MKKIISSLIGRAFKDQRGQAVVIVAVSMVAIFGVAGLTIDVGRAYVIRNQLQISTNAAGLAAAGAVYNTNSLTNATAVATAYANANALSGLSQNPGFPLVSKVCLKLLAPAGTDCSSSPTPNAVKVSEQVSVPTMFMRIFGINSLTVGAMATASMQGSAQPWNVVIIEDATGSMTSADANCGGVTQFECALEGIQTMLAQTSPCLAGVSNCNPSNSNFRVALFSFPNMTTADLQWVNACAASSYAPSSTAPYTPTPYTVVTLPKETATSYAPLTYKMGATTWSSSYQLTYSASATNSSNPDVNGFVSDYYDATNTSTGGLNPNSQIVKALGYGAGAKVGCLKASMMQLALNNDGVQGSNITYYPGVIYAAQAALEAEQVLHPEANNAIILLGDGQQTTPAKYFPPGTATPQAKNPSPPYPNTPSTISNAALGYSTLTANGVYPSAVDECQQSIVAAQAAEASGTRVYAVAYGSQTSGCGTGGTDTSLIVTKGLNVPMSSVSKVTPCTTMENIASTLDYFYSDYLQSGSGSTCKDNSHSITSLKDIFAAIAASFGKPRLLPNSAT